MSEQCSIMGLLLHCRYTSQFRQSCILNCWQEIMRTLPTNLVTWAAPLIGPATITLLCTLLVVKLRDGTSILITQRSMSASTTPSPARVGTGTTQVFSQRFVKEEAAKIPLTPADSKSESWTVPSVDWLLDPAIGASSGAFDGETAGIVFGVDLNANLRLGAISERTFCN